jgi:hypothetical protein
MKFPASELSVALQPLFQNGVDVWLRDRTIEVQFALEKRDDYDSTFYHDGFLFGLQS